jgi:hypothetical protein
MIETINRFMDNMKTLSEKEYMFNLITYGIAPTICGYKASTLITLSHKYKNTYNLWKNYKEEYLSSITLKCYELNKTEEAYTVLFYDENGLSYKVQQINCRNFLKDFGYSEDGSIINYLWRLKQKYREGCPHEIGIFLDIPYEDVIGFIKNDGKNSLYCGYWKVYSQVEQAREIFKKYDICKKKVIELIAQGKNTFEVLKELERMYTQ